MLILIEKQKVIWHYKDKQAIWLFCIYYDSKKHCKKYIIEVVKKTDENVEEKNVHRIRKRVFYKLPSIIKRFDSAYIVQTIFFLKLVICIGDFAVIEIPSNSIRKKQIKKNKKLFKTC